MGEAPAIFMEQPEDTTVFEGSNATFDILVNVLYGVCGTIDWYKGTPGEGTETLLADDDVNYSWTLEEEDGNYRSVLTIIETEESDEGTYFARFTGNVTGDSNTAELTVSPTQADTQAEWIEEPIDHLVQGNGPTPGDADGGITTVEGGGITGREWGITKESGNPLIRECNLEWSHFANWNPDSGPRPEIGSREGGIGYPCDPDTGLPYKELGLELLYNGAFDEGDDAPDVGLGWSVLGDWTFDEANECLILQNSTDHIARGVVIYDTDYVSPLDDPPPSEPGDPLGPFDLGPMQGKTFRLTYAIGGTTTGFSLVPHCGGWTGTTRTEAGTYSEDFTALTEEPLSFVRTVYSTEECVDDAYLTLDGVSLKTAMFYPFEIVNGAVGWRYPLLSDDNATWTFEDVTPGDPTKGDVGDLNFGFWTKLTFDPFLDDTHVGRRYFARFWGAGDPVDCLFVRFGDLDLGGQPPHDPDPPPTEIPFYTRACSPLGMERDLASLVAAEFGPALIIDLETGRFFTATDFAFTCFFQVSGPCAEEGEFPSKLFAGGADGYLYEVMAEGYYGNGAPVKKLLWTVGEGSTTENIVLAWSEGDPFLPAGMCDGLTVRVKYADGTTVDKIITTNTNTEISLASALTTVPAEGDTIHLAPCECVVLWPERRFQDPSMIDAVRLNVRNRQSAKQDMTLEVYGEEDGQNDVDLSAAKATLDFDTDQLRTKRGIVSMPGNTSVANAVALRFTPVGGGELSISNVSANQVVGLLDMRR